MSPDVDLKEYFDRILDERTKRFEIALHDAQKAVEIADTNSEKWRSNANEWRAAMDDREREFARKPDLETAARDIRELRDWRNTMEGKADQKDVTRAQILGVISMAIGLISLALSILGR